MSYCFCRTHLGKWIPRDLAWLDFFPIPILTCVLSWFSIFNLLFVIDVSVNKYYWYGWIGATDPLRWIQKEKTGFQRSWSESNLRYSMFAKKVDVIGTKYEKPTELAVKTSFFGNIMKTSDSARKNKPMSEQSISMIRRNSFTKRHLNAERILSKSFYQLKFNTSRMN